MKKLFYLVFLSTFFTYGQVVWDNALSQIYQPTASFDAKKVLIDKVSSFSDLYNFGDETHYTSNATHFKQSLSELYRASNQQYFQNYTNFPNFTTEIKNATSIPLGIISTKCSYLNYDEDNVSNGNLTLTNGVFYRINNSLPSFIEKDVLVISPLYPAFTSNSDSFTFNINTNQWYQYVNVVKKIEANFGDGIFRTIIDNGIITNANITVNITIPNNAVKKQEIEFRVTYNNNTIKNTKASILLSKRNNDNFTTFSSNCSNSTLLKHRYSIADNTGIFGELEYRVYYKNNNNNCVVKKPVIIVDGFDTGDKRRVSYQDCINDARCVAANTKPNSNITFDNYKSIEKLMMYEVG